MFADAIRSSQRREAWSAMTHPIDHVALLVPRIEPVLEKLGGLAEEAGDIEEFPSEGTRELYVGGDGRQARLLLMEARGDQGPYARALAKRGPGLHHVALDVPDLDAFLVGLRGWLVHPACLPGLARSRTLWLARPGISTLLEVHEAEPGSGKPVVEGVEVPARAELAELLHLRVREGPVAGLLPSPDGSCWLRLGGRRLAVAELLDG